MSPSFEIRQTPTRGRGLFSTSRLTQGSFLLSFQGWQARTDELDSAWLALQIDHDLWLCSSGDLLDDCANHSCVPNAGFLTGEPALHALRDIDAGEEIVWDYSTSLSLPGWEMQCRCGAPTCRDVIRPWAELKTEERERLRSFSLRYLRAFG